MDSKAQKAMVKAIKKEIRYLINNVKSDDYRDGIQPIYEEIVWIDKKIKEYKLEKMLLFNAENNIYKILMKRRMYIHAAEFAKKYGL